MKNKNTSLKNLEKREKELKKQMEQLEKEKEKELIKTKKAFKCKCGKTVINKNAVKTELDQQLCRNCVRKKTRKEYQQKIFTKIKYGKIVDIELDSVGWYPNIKKLVVQSQGIMYELKAVQDDGDVYLIIDNEWETDDQEELPVIRPGDKPRCEKPLFALD